MSICLSTIVLFLAANATNKSDANFYLSITVIIMYILMSISAIVVMRYLLKKIREGYNEISQKK